MPKAYHGVLHPVLVTAVVANAGLALQGKLLGISYAAAQKAYLAKVGNRRGWIVRNRVVALAWQRLSERRLWLGRQAHTTTVQLRSWVHCEGCSKWRVGGLASHQLVAMVADDCA